MARRKRQLEQELDSLRAEVARRARQADDETTVLNQVLANVSQGIIVVDPDDTIAYFNPAAATLIRPGDTLSGLAPHPLQSLVRIARQVGKPQERELEVDRPHRILTAAASPISEAGRVLVVLVDVTELRRVEAVRRDFAVAASHELKTPVAAILASAEALQMALDRDPEIARRFASQVESSARRLGDLVADLLDLSRVEAALMPADEVDMVELVRSETASLEAQAKAAAVSLMVEVEPGRVIGSRADLGLALRNLLDNAFRHAPGGEVRLVGRSVGDSYRLEVSDTGEGIPSRDLPRIFERFYRVDGARARATGGTGLGLALVRHIVEGHGGTVEARSALGEGATFVVELPIA